MHVTSVSVDARCGGERTTGASERQGRGRDWATFPQAFPQPMDHCIASVSTGVIDSASTPVDFHRFVASPPHDVRVVTRAYPPGGTRETHVSTKQPEAQEDSRLPSAHADEGRPCRPEGPQEAWSSTPVSLIWRVRDRDTFGRLARARPWRRGPITIRVVRTHGENDPPRVAYAIGRKSGNAVVRNRLRRRLRSAMSDTRGILKPGHSYLVSASSGAAGLTYSDLVFRVSEAVRAAGVDAR